MNTYLDINNPRSIILANFFQYGHILARCGYKEKDIRKEFARVNRRNCFLFLNNNGDRLFQGDLDEDAFLDRLAEIFSECYRFGYILPDDDLNRIAYECETFGDSCNASATEIEEIHRFFETKMSCQILRDYMRNI